MAGDNYEVFMTRSLNVTPKTAEQHLIVHSGKFEAEVTLTEECAQCIVLLKLNYSTDRHLLTSSLPGWTTAMHC